MAGGRSVVTFAKLAKWTFGVSAVIAVIALVVVIDPFTSTTDRGGAERAQAGGSAETAAGIDDASPQNPPPEESDLPPEFPETDIPSEAATAPNRFAGGAQTAWVLADRNAIAPERLPPHQETYTDARLVSLAGGLGNWSAGSRVFFDIPHTGERLESVIERVESGLAGNLSYIGRVDRDDALHRVVGTVGTRNAFAYIDSGQGSYELVGNREFGWLMSTAGMEQHVDYSKSDIYPLDDSQRDEP